jgi:phage baseplate assembly protein gpV
VESSTVDSQFIGALTNVLVHAVDVTVDGTQKEKLQQSLTFLQKLQNQL